MVRKYFAAANTASGYIDFTENNLEGTEKIYALSGMSKKQKSEILKEIAKGAEKKYQNIECLISPFDVSDLDAVIIRDTKTAVLDKDRISTKKEAEIMELDNKKPSDISKIRDISAKEIWAMQEFSKAYVKAKEIHDEWEKIYIKNMDYKRLEAYEKGLIETLFNKERTQKGTQKYHRFFGASTPDGSVNYIDNLTENLKARYFIKGRPGTGKSTFLKALVREADKRGFDTEIYYCSFDKESLDMVIVPELGFCVFDSTKPHEMFPESDRDSILDFYKESGLTGVDEKFSKELSEISGSYSCRIAEGVSYLRLGKIYYKEREDLILKNCDYDNFLKSKREIKDKILGT